MKPLEETYGARFFKQRHRLNWRAPVIACAIKEAFHPKRMIDVGCATADIVKALNEIGVWAVGIEGSPAVMPYLEYPAVFFWDLRMPLPRQAHEMNLDLAISFEVAEHIEPEYAKVYVENLTHLSDRVLMSAATPGQGGVGHVNCQLRDYWDVLFADKNYRYDEDKVSDFRNCLEGFHHKAGVRAIYYNALYYEKVNGDDRRNDNGD